MTGQEFRIIFIEDKAWLTPGRSFTLQQAGLPDWVKSFAAPAFWTVRVLKYVELERRLHCEIISYAVGPADFPDNQKAMGQQLSSLTSISYRSLDTPSLMRTLSSTTRISLRPAVETPVFGMELPQAPRSFKRISESFFVPIKELRFKDGAVTFKRKFKGVERPIEFSIPNPDIREEYDAVKEYLVNVLHTKKIQVTATIEVEFKELQAATAQSREIAQINKGLIEELRLEIVKVSIKKAAAETEQHLFAMNELLENFGPENLKIDTFYSDEKDLLEDLLKITDTKHYQHLRFLSGKHCHQIMNLRFLLKPFSFLFLLEGKCNYYLVWETLNTEEATYNWRTAKNPDILETDMPKIESIIKHIKAEGKKTYLNATDQTFQRIFHDYNEGVDGFSKWKSELESRLS